VLVGRAPRTTLGTAQEQLLDDDPRPLLLALDGDGLIHRAHHGWAGAAVTGGWPDRGGGAGPGLGDRDALGRPTWALRGLVTSLAVAAARLRPAAVLVGLDSRVDPVRKAMFAGYKAHRPPREPDLATQLDAAPDLLADAGLPHACVTGYEGDDVLASAAALARREGWRCILVTSDRDAFALIDATTSVLRVIDGGVQGGPILTPARLASAYGVAPEQYRDLAALRGDTSDNLPGVPGVGAKTAARLLRRFGSAEAVFAALDGSAAADVVEVAGASCTAQLADPAARAVVARNQQLMAMRADLPLPDAAALRLPVAADLLTGALRARGIGLGPSLWALVGGDPPPWEPNGYDAAPRALPGGVRPPWAGRAVPSLAELAAIRELALGRERQLATERAGLAATGAGGVSRKVRTPSVTGGVRRGPARRPRPVPAGQLPLF
jgi:DNA polymerase-1